MIDAISSRRPGIDRASERRAGTVSARIVGPQTRQAATAGRLRKAAARIPARRPDRGVSGSAEPSSAGDPSSRTRAASDQRTGRRAVHEAPVGPASIRPDAPRRHAHGQSASTRRCRFGERAMNRVTFSSLPRAESPRKQADIAQLVERNLAKVEVAGSSPVVRSIPISGAIGAAVARFLDTEEVTGSNPVSPTITSRPSACRRRP